jgi:hypothetical protein
LSPAPQNGNAPPLWLGAHAPHLPLRTIASLGEHITTHEFGQVEPSLAQTGS